MVRFERTFPHPVAAVWEAVTDPAQLEQWFPTSVQFSALATGASISFRFPRDAYPPMTGEVLEVDPQRLLRFSSGNDQLMFELEPRSNGSACRLSFSVLLDSREKAARDAAGWDQCLDMLDQVAGGRAPTRPAPSDVWRAYYEEYKRRGLPASAPLPE